jgi:hypothetical protein
MLEPAYQNRYRSRIRHLRYQHRWPLFPIQCLYQSRYRCPLHLPLHPQQHSFAAGINISGCPSIGGFAAVHGCAASSGFVAICDAVIPISAITAAIENTLRTRHQAGWDLCR